MGGTGRARWAGQPRRARAAVCRPAAAPVPADSIRPDPGAETPAAAAGTGRGCRRRRRRGRSRSSAPATCCCTTRCGRRPSATPAAEGRTGYDFAPMFASVKPVVSAADLAICHMETPLGPADGPFSGYPSFSVPPQVATGLADLGYDSCSTASNHSLDQGEAGVARTLDALDAAGIRHAGTARSPAEAAEPDPAARPTACRWPTCPTLVLQRPAPAGRQAVAGQPARRRRRARRGAAGPRSPGRRSSS